MKRLVMMAVALVAVATVGLAQETAAPAAAAPAPAVAKEEKSPLSFAATLDFYSAYVWRGQVFNDRPVWQPGATVSYDTGDYGKLSAGVWANFNADDRINRTKTAGLDEVDYTLTYSKDVGPVSLAAGHTWYTFPREGGNDYGKLEREIFVTAQYNNDIVNPFVKVYYDYEVAEGFYANAGLNKSISVGDRVTVGSEVSLGAADSSYVGYISSGTETDKAFVDFNAALFTSYALTDNVSIGARIVWTSVVDQDLRKGIDGVHGSNDNKGVGSNYGDTDILWGGVNLAVNF